MRHPSGRGVLVTGAGVVSALGHGVQPFWEAQLAGRSGTRRLAYPWLEGRSFHTRVGAPVDGFELERWGYTARDLRWLDPVSQFALGATAMALAEAGLTPVRADTKSTEFRIPGLDAERVAVILGTGMGGIRSLEAAHDHYLKVGGPQGGSWVRYGLPMSIPNAAGAEIAIRHGFHGECKSVTTACAAGSMAIGDACRLIWSGGADVVIAGGTESALSDHDGLGLMAFDVLNCMSRADVPAERASRPFHAERDGFVLGEGSGILVLESEDHARARGARGLAEIAAYESACDAHSMLQPEPTGAILARTIRAALASADVLPAEVDYLNPHATATQVGDLAEAHAIRLAFGADVDRVRVGATKSLTGHAIAASGAFEAITCVLAIQHGLIPATANLDEVGAGCELNHVRGGPHAGRVNVAASTSNAFGGHAAVLVFRAL